MAARKVMSREEAFDSIARAGAAALAGEPLPDEISDTVVMEAADAADGMHAFVREIAGLFDRIPASVSDEVVIQEAVRLRLDKIFSEVVISMEEVIKRLTQP